MEDEERLLLLFPDLKDGVRASAVKTNDGFPLLELRMIPWYGTMRRELKIRYRSWYKPLGMYRTAGETIEAHDRAVKERRIKTQSR